jgi:branched-chain amino acid transport system substrate-binding protein
LKPVEIAAREINATGGAEGFPIELVEADDQCEPGFALRIANQQVERSRPKFVIGPTCPSAAMATAPIYAKAGVIQFLPTVPVSLIGYVPGQPHNAFSMIASDEQEARALGSYLKRAHAGKKLTVVYTDAFYRRGIVELVKEALPDEMKESARFVPLLDISGVYDRVADKIRRDRPDIVYMALDHWPLVQLVEKLRKRGLDAILMGGQRVLSYNFWLKGRNIAEGIHVIVPVGSPATPELRKTIDVLKRSGVIADLVALNSYASVQILAEAVRRAGGGEPSRVARLLRSEEFQAAVGPVSFDQLGRRRDLQFSVLVWHDGRPQRLE